MEEKINIAEILSIDDLPNEIWKDIPEYKGFYQVSNFGRVKSLKRFFKAGRGRIAETKLRILKQADSTDGYKMVSLCINGEQFTRRVHRLVAMAFIPNPYNYPVINHKNEIRTDNRCSNLEWCTVHHNNMHAVNMGLYKNLKSVTQLDKNGKIINTFKSIREAERITGIDSSGIAKCCKGKRKIAGGYCWRYN